MAVVHNVRVSRSGTMTVPVDLRVRWNLQEGGEIGYIDLGGAALVIPGGLDSARAELRRVLEDRYEAAVASIDDQLMHDDVSSGEPH